MFAELYEKEKLSRPILSFFLASRLLPFLLLPTYLFLSLPQVATYGLRLAVERFFAQQDRNPIFRLAHGGIIVAVAINIFCEVIIRYDPYLQLRCAVRRAAVVVYGEVQLL